MQTIYKWLMPGFLRSWDSCLLESYPIVWRTRAHYVLYFASVATLMLFALGYFYPVSATPNKPIILGEEKFYILPLAMLSLGILYWGYTQYQVGFASAKPKHVLLTLLIYGVCFFIITGITAPAFCIGNILSTPHSLTDKKDFWDILFRHWEVTLGYLPLLALLLFAIPYLSVRTVLVVFIFIGLFGGTSIMSIGLDKQLLNEDYLRNSTINLLITVISLLYLAFSVVQGKINKYSLLAFHLIPFCIATILFFKIMGGKWLFRPDELDISKPVNLAFFGVQVIGLAGVLLIAYLQALPRRV